jgi:hypothetical protein
VKILVSYIKRRRQIESFCEQGDEENICYEREGGRDRGCGLINIPYFFK